MTKPLTTEEYIIKARKAHGDKYDYSKVKYKNSNTKIQIGCPMHGEFWQIPYTHLTTCGCPKCGNEIRINNIRKNNETFVENAKKIHGDKYDYTKVEYVSAKTKVCILCPVHGEFWQKPLNHLNGCGCPKCGNETRRLGSKKTKTTEDFINECIEKFGDRYDFSKTIYNGSHNNITVFDRLKNCEIITTPTTFLSRNYSTKIKVSKENFINKAKEKFGDKYDYNETEYINSKTKIRYVCPKHGEIEQLPLNHLRYGCRYCSKEINSLKRCLTLNEFIEKAKAVHGDKYDYSEVNYINSSTKVCIICPEHGEFWQMPSKHLSGHGCPKCNRSHLEEEMSLFLSKNNIEYIEQYAPSFLKNGNGLQKIDFYLPQYNVAIECQGLQHFTDEFYIKNKKLKSNITRDEMKYNKCKNNGVNLLYYTTARNILLKDFNPIYNSENIFSDKDLLLEKIKSFNNNDH